MAQKIVIKVGEIELEAELNDTAAAKAVWNTLPYAEQGSTWGDELYFAIPEELDLELEYAQDVVQAGDLGYWPVGNAFCIFYGPTPMSIDEEEIRPASPVTVIGRISGDATILREVKSGARVVIEKR
jgi:hypothetical protein